MSAHSAAGVSGAQLGTENVTPNSAVDTFRTEAWNEFLHLYGTLRPPHPTRSTPPLTTDHAPPGGAIRYGEALVVHLLLHEILLVTLPNQCFYQVSGNVPLSLNL